MTKRSDVIERLAFLAAWIPVAIVLGVFWEPLATVAMSVKAGGLLLFLAFLGLGVLAITLRMATKWLIADARRTERHKRVGLLQTYYGDVLRARVQESLMADPEGVLPFWGREFDWDLAPHGRAEHCDIVLLARELAGANTAAGVMSQDCDVDIIVATEHAIRAAATRPIGSRARSRMGQTVDDAIEERAFGESAAYA